MRILIADPDEAAAHVMNAVARIRGHSAVIASSHDEIAAFRSFGSRICIASQELCSVRGLAALRDTALEGESPLIILTYDQMRADERSRALDGGVDDLVRRPFHVAEIIATAERQVDRARAQWGAADSTFAGDVTVRLDEFWATKNELPLPLTLLELRLLDQLVRSANHMVPRDALVVAAWREEDAMPDASLLKTHISHLRTKLRRAGGQPVAIESSYGLGYRLTIC